MTAAAPSAELRDLMGVIGIEATVKLAESFGGRRLYVSRQFSPAHPVAKLIGEDAAALLGEHFHQTSITFPMRARRHALVRALAAQEPKLTRAEIAERAICSERTVYLILASDATPPARRPKKRDPRQTSLFD